MSVLLTRLQRATARACLRGAAQPPSSAIAARLTAASCRFIHASAQLHSGVATAAALSSQSDLSSDLTSPIASPLSAAPSDLVAVSSPVTRYVCVVEYLGTNYHGWSPSAERHKEGSVAGAIEVRLRSASLVNSLRTAADHLFHSLTSIVVPCCVTGLRVVAVWWSRGQSCGQWSHGSRCTRSVKPHSQQPSSSSSSCHSIR